MGVENSNSVEKNQEQQRILLMEASRVVKELNMAENETQIKEQRHLIARILIYGQKHLIAHLLKMPNQRRKTFLKVLKKLDYETIDMLFQNRNLSSSKLQYESISALKKSEIQQEKMTSLGKKLLLNKKVGIIIFIAGPSSRFQGEQGVEDKAFYKQKQNDKCLLEIMLEKISQKFNVYGEQQLFIIHNEQNLQRLNTLLMRFKSLKAKKVFQNNQYIVNQKGQLCVKSENSCQILHSASGCGDFYNTYFRGEPILQYIQNSKVQLVYCVGIQNIYEQVLDYGMIGYLNSTDYDALYKCTYPQWKGQNLKRITRLNNSSIVSNYQNLKASCAESRINVIQNSPVWMNSMIFKVKSFKKYLKEMPQLIAKKSQQLKMTINSKKVHYWNGQEEIHESCFTFERQLSDVIINKHINSAGVMVSRQEEFMPVISLHDEHIWREAYKQYTSKLEKSVIPNDSLVSNYLE